MKIVKKPIEVISYCDMQGNIKPMKFRFQDDDNCWINVKVDKIMKRDIEKLAGYKMLVYTCVSNIEGVQKIYELKCEIDSSKWLLFKI